MDGEVMSCAQGALTGLCFALLIHSWLRWTVRRERARLRAVLLSVAQQCGGPVQFAVRKIAEEMK